jgi:hypothetical protein
MALIVAIDLIMVGALVAIALTKGLERTLPFFVFLLIVIPEECKIQFSGLFDLSTQRLLLVTFCSLYLILPKPIGPSPFRKTPLRWLIAAQVIWCLISTADSIVPVISIKKMLSEVVEYYLLYYLVVKSISHLRTVHKVLGAVLIAVLVASAFGAVEAYTGWGVGQFFPHSYGGAGGLDIDVARGLRARSTFPDPILLGVAIAMAVPLALFFLSSAKAFSMRAGLWLGIMLMFLTIYKTVSRGPWFALALSLTLLLLYSSPGLRSAIAKIALLTALVLLIRPGVWDSVRNILVDTQDPNSPLGLSYQYRFVLFDLATGALNRDAERALWGYGIESFVSVGLTAPVFGEQIDRPFRSCDSTWINFMVETGYVGLGLMCALLLTPAVLCLQDVRNVPGDRRYLSWVLFVMLVGYYFMMTNVEIYSWGQNGYMLWVVIALSLVYGRLSRIEQGSDKAWPSFPAAIAEQEFAHARH